MDFNEKYNQYLELINREIELFFNDLNFDAPQGKVFDAMKYAVLGGGKRLRPVLTIACANICGGNIKDSTKVAMAIELIHNYSLIHDDLPCMDDDDLRRGRKTCHKVYGEDIALLAGDALLNCAFEILSDENNFKTLDYKSIVKIINILSSASGAKGMIGGQVVDLLSENKDDVTLDTLLYLHERKTGALIRAAVLCGCACGKETEENKEITKSLDCYAQSLGLAFQIKDDILDVTGSTQTLGKPIGSDIKSNKTTFVSLLGLDGARDFLEKETQESIFSIKNLKEESFFKELANFLLNRQY